MKTIRTLTLAVLCGLTVAVFTSCSSTGTGTGSSTTVTEAPVAGANNLQVVLSIPPSWHPMLEDRIDDAFVSHLADIFRQQGFNGNIVDVRPPDQPNPNYPVMTINLIQWRMDHTGNVDCTFTADLQTQGGSQQLGSFDGMAIRWMEGPGRFGLADTYGSAIDDALRQLATSVMRSQAVPGFVSR